MSSKRSRVHPPYKTKYRVTNWATDSQALVDRGSLGLWISPYAIANWNAKPGRPRPGGQPKYSNLAIESALPLGLVYHLPLLTGVKLFCRLASTTFAGVLNSP